MSAATVFSAEAERRSFSISSSDNEIGTSPSIPFLPMTAGHTNL